MGLQEYFNSNEDYILDVEFLEYTTRRLFDWRDNPPIPPGKDYNKTLYDGLDYQDQSEAFIECLRIDQALQFLCTSRTFMAMLEDEPSIANIDIHFEYLKTAAANYCPKKDKIRISKYQYDRHGGNASAYTNLAAHELRHGWQKRKGIFNDLDKMSARSIMLLNRAYEADCAAFQIAVSWDLKTLGDEAHLDILKQFSAHRISTSAFIGEGKHIYKRLQDEDWRNALESGEYADETGEMQQAAFDGFFRDRYLKESYDSYALRVFSKVNFNRRRQICPREDAKLLAEKLSALSSMPYININSGITDRPKYQPSRIIDKRYAGLYSRIAEAPTLMHLRHVNRRRQPDLKPKPKPIFS